ncbi:prepilin-type N-terminal cleavage/methylation domain-containing protein [bacterium]|nr:prepilin-type N-terminal cleavage/methylation domain-containing protein [bacterium]
MLRSRARHVRVRKQTDLRCQDGFTLIEISIMLLIVSIVSMLVLPRMSSFLSSGPETFARRLHMTVRSCRERSIMHHQPYRIVLDLEKQVFFVETLTETRQDEFSYQIDPSVLHRMVKVPSNIRIEDVSTPLTGMIKEGQAYIILLQDGLFPGAQVHLIDDEKQHYTLIFHPLTGRLLFERGYVYTETEQQVT